MKILYLLTRQPDETLSEIMECQRREHTVEIEDLRAGADYEAIVDRIFSCDTVISW